MLEDTYFKIKRLPCHITRDNWVGRKDKKNYKISISELIFDIFNQFNVDVDIYILTLKHIDLSNLILIYQSNTLYM